MYKIAEIQVSYSNKNPSNVKITSSKICYELFIGLWDQNTIELLEECKMLLLNRNNKVLGVYNVSKGGVSGTIVDPKIVFSVALKCNASAIILAHNHPSGNLSPSQPDKTLTRKLKQASELLQIDLLDHLIIASTGYYSLADNGELY